MALLIDIKQPVWMKDEELAGQLFAINPKADIRCSASPGNLDEITMLAVSSYYEGEALRYPNLKLVQKIGAGVDSIMADRQLPESIQVARLSSNTPGQEMAEFSLACVLQEQRHLRLYAANQAKLVWAAQAPRRANKTSVAILGLGRIGAQTAQKFVDCDFRVLGWSRSQKQLAGVECRSGYDQLPSVLAEADYVIAILPSTPETIELFNRKSFAWMKPAAVIINIGRGTLINESDLLEALDKSVIGGAILDVMQNEPLPEQSPLWTHPKVLITPHVSGWHLGEAILDIAENYQRLASGKMLLNLVNRQLGY